MSEEENENGPQFSMFYMQLPPEVQEMMNHQHMVHMQNAHDGVNFFDSLDENQLKVIRGIFAVMHTQPDSIPYYMGLTSGILGQKFGICIACGSKHDDELRDLAGEGDPSVQRTVEDEDALLDEYNLKRIPNAVSLMCKGCNRVYPNLNDRMLKKPGIEGCDGCIEKEKWG